MILAAACCVGLGRAETAPRRDTPIRPKVLVLTFDPAVEAEGGRRLSEVCGWSDPNALVQTYVHSATSCT